MRKLKIEVHTGFVGATHEDEVGLPDDWDELSEHEQEDFIDECVQEIINDRIDGYAYVEETDE